MERKSAGSAPPDGAAESPLIFAYRVGALFVPASRRFLRIVFCPPPPHHPTPPPPPSATPSPFSTPSSPSLTFFVGWGVGGRRFGFEAVGGSLERVEADVGVGLGGGGWWVEWVLRPPPPPPPPPPQAFSRPERRWIGFFKRLYLVFFYRVFYFDSIFFLVWSLISGPRSLY